MSTLRLVSKVIFIAAMALGAIFDDPFTLALGGILYIGAILEDRG